MGKEIERKYLLKTSDWKKDINTSTKITQGYLNSDKRRTVRVRIIGNQGYLTIKGKNIGATRPEYEYEIPIEDASAMLSLCENPIIDKVRHTVKVGAHIWEIDEFSGQNEGLIVAEIELQSEDEKFDPPDWIGKEVTYDTKYYNSNLVAEPYSTWSILNKSH